MQIAIKGLLKAIEVRLSKRDRLRLHQAILIKQTKETLTKKLGFNELTKLPIARLMAGQYKEILKIRKKALGSAY